MISKQGSKGNSIKTLGTWDEVGHLGKSINNNKDRVIGVGKGQCSNEIKGNGLPSGLGN